VSSYGTESGTNASGTGGITGTSGAGGPVGGLPGGGEKPVAGTHDMVLLTSPAAAQVVSAVVASKITVPVTFNSSDGRTITNFALSTAAALPAGWTAPQQGFACPMVSTGSSCVLNLTYQPTAYTTPKTIILDYVFVDDAGEPVTIASGNFQYQATTNDNVIATLAPLGQINATIGMAAQTVTVTYVTDDGHPAANLSVTSPATLPAGWSGPTPSTCATVSNGTACTMAYSYQPTAPGSGTLMVGFAYDNDSATAKTGTFSIPYLAIDHNTIVATPSMNPITVANGTSQAVTITFTTSDGFPASNFAVTSNLAALNTYWTSGAPSLTCATVSTGNTCSLTLTYAPTVSGDSGAQQITYSFTDNAGTANSASVNINYSST
jgi:hypothetical protein